MAGRVVIVTGGFGVLGRAVATAFAAQGDKVARVDFAADAPDPNPDGIDIGGTDLTDMGASLRAVDQVLSAFGGIDILINIAGGFTWQTLRDGDIAAWQRMFAMNVLTSATMTKAALPALEKSRQARVINIGAGAAVQAGAGMGAYAAAKSGVHRLTESLASEMGASICVNAILPTIIDTPTNRMDMPDADTSSWVKPEAIADVALFLASPAARAINGALIPVNRGGPA